MTDYIEHFKFKCPTCEALISIEEIENHEHDGRKFAIHEYISHQVCPFCKNYFSLDSLIQGICGTCDLDSGPRRSSEPSPLAERLDRNLHFAYLSNPGIEGIEDFVEEWLSKFELQDRGLLTWLLTGRLLNNHIGEYGSPVWHTPTFQELALDRKMALLPRDGTDKSQITVLREWYAVWKQATLNKQPIQFDGDPPPTSQDVESQLRHNKSYIDNLEAIWGLENGSLRPFRELSEKFDLAPSRIRQIIARSWSDAQHGRRETSHINEVRNQLLWMARVIDVFALPREKYAPTEALFQILTEYLEDLPDFERVQLLSMIQAEMSIQDISLETDIHISRLQSTIDEFIEVMENSN